MTRAVIFVHYDRDDIVDNYVYHYLRELQKNSSDLIFVSTAQLMEKDLETLSNYCSKIIVRENIGYDFMSYKIGLEQIDDNNYDEVLICNDSVYGPLYPIDELFESMRSNKCDFWGITDNTDMSYHIQSYFMLVKKPVLQSKAFKEFWKNVEVLDNKDEIIKRYEVGFSQTLINEGFIPAVSTHFQATKIQKLSIFMSKFTPAKIVKKLKSILTGQAQIIRIGKINATHYFWKDLLISGHIPFVKIELLRDNPMNVDIEDFETTISHNYDYDITLVTNHLQRMKESQ
jgi:lipopolysaccharide biosynthesis protein